VCERVAHARGEIARVLARSLSHAIELIGSQSEHLAYVMHRVGQLRPELPGLDHRAGPQSFTLLPCRTAHPQLHNLAAAPERRAGGRATRDLAAADTNDFLSLVVISNSRSNRIPRIVIARTMGTELGSTHAC